MRYKLGDSQSATYWRRRFIALVGGLAIFALMAWSVSGALGGVKVSPAANVVRKAGHGKAGGGAGPGAAAPGTARHSSTSPRPGPSASAAGHAASTGPAPAGSRRPGKAHARPPGKAHARPHGEPHARPHGPPHGGTRACAGGKVVISLFASQVSYAAQARPEFQVDVVSTAARPCVFNVGTAHLAVVIKAGSVRIWSSADCARGRKSLPTALVKGVPTVLPISWDRMTSSPGCKLASSAVPAGIYAATASNGQLGSNMEIFRLR